MNLAYKEPLLLCGMMLCIAAGPANNAVSKAIPAVLEKRFAEILKDPVSLQFKDVHRVHVSHDSYTSNAVCGMYNSKNSYGGYVGFKRFVYYPERGGTLITVDAIYHSDGSVEDAVEIAKRELTSFDQIGPRHDQIEALLERQKQALMSCL